MNTTDLAEPIEVTLLKPKVVELSSLVQLISTMLTISDSEQQQPYSIDALS